MEAITGAAIVPHMPTDSGRAAEATQRVHIEWWEIRTNRPASERTTKPKIDRKPSRQKDATGPMSCRTQWVQLDFGEHCEGESIEQHACTRYRASTCPCARKTKNKSFSTIKMSSPSAAQVNLHAARTNCPEQLIPTNNALSRLWAARQKVEPRSAVAATGAAIVKMLAIGISVIVRRLVIQS